MADFRIGLLRQKPNCCRDCESGFLAGLVGITPAAGFVAPLGAILIGLITATCCFFAVSLRAKFQFDDSLDTFPVHGVGGTVGAIITGLFATKSVNSLGWGWLVLCGGLELLGKQIAGVVITYIFAAIATLQFQGSQFNYGSAG